MRRDVSVPILSRICYVRFSKKESVGVAQHLTNTVFIDRALIIIPVVEGQIPEEKKALQLMQTGNLVPGVDVKLPPHVLSQLTVDNPPVIVTSDPNLAENNLPAYPPLPSNLDTRTMEEIRRTLLVTNIDPEISPEAVIEHFSRAGEIKYLKMGVRKDPENPEAEPERAGLIEFTEQPSIIEALKMDKTKLGNNEIRVHHAVEAIRKPQAKLAKSNEVAQKEIEDAVKKAKDAQNLITASLDPVLNLSPVLGLIEGAANAIKQSVEDGEKDGERRRTRSRSRRKSRSRDRKRSRSSSRSAKRRRRSRSRERRRGRSRTRSPRRRSRSRERNRRSRSRERRRREEERRRNRSRSPRKRRSPSPPPRRRRTRSRSRTPPRKRRERERSRSRSPKRRNRRSRSRDKDEKKKSRRSRSASPSSSRKRKGSGESKVEQPKVKPRNYDEEEEFYEEKTLETMQQNKKKGEESDEDMSSKTSDGGGDKMEISDGED